MTDSQWRESTDPQLMLEAIRHTGDPRKLRLFGLACSRRIEHLLAQGPIRELVGMIERCAEGSLPELDVYWASWERHDAAHITSIDGEAALAVLAAAGLPRDWIIGSMPSGTYLFPIIREDIAEPRLVSAMELAALHGAAALAWEADPSGYNAAWDAATDEDDGSEWAQRARSIARQLTMGARWAAALSAAENEQAGWLRELFGANAAASPADERGGVY